MAKLFLVLPLFANFVFQLPQSLHGRNEMCSDVITSFKLLLKLHDSNFIFLYIGSKRAAAMTDKMEW